ncbi:MAG: serine/threonine protein kinase [Myxococcaceae bacterium]|jgi:tRNA A-37 threonylcarbamoyl transferase component Bud32|nr:serine/threonine protein kinase [Myxococcaceae bacterium]MCA3011457.1 serine/threonine protein kinase [Myxococcaceae bacterium]
MTDERGPRPVALGSCPTCGRQFELAQRVCLVHRVPLVEATQRNTEPEGLFSLSDARTDFERPSLGVAQDTLLERPALGNDAPRTDPAGNGLFAAPGRERVEPPRRPSVRDVMPVVARGGATDRQAVATVVEAAVGPARARASPGPLPTARPLEEPTEPLALGVPGSSGKPLVAPRLSQRSLPPTPVDEAQLRADLTGQRFDGYEVTGPLAEGGMSVVYEAQHTLLGTQAVVKVLKKLLTADPVSMRRMVTEGQTLSALTHRNVVRVFGFGYLPDGRPWLLMERLVGETLGALLRAGQALPVGEALPLMRQLAAGLEATHALGVVHRDLKPDNVYVVVEPDGERLVKLIDFGIARPDILDAPGDARTAVGRFVGTPAYGAPELFLGKPCSPASDVYALGVCFFEMLTGRRPFTETQLAGLTQLHLEAAPPRLSSLVRGVDARMDALVASMLAKRPDERPSLTEVRTSLEAMGGRTTRSGDLVPWLVAALVAIALGVGAGLWLR